MADLSPILGSTKPDSGRSPELFQELRIVIECGGKTSPEALRELRRGLIDAATRRRDPLVVLQNLGLLEDSILTFMKGLSRLLIDYPRTVTFWESSGYAEAFLSAMEGSSSAPPDPSGPPLSGTPEGLTGPG